MDDEQEEKRPQALTFGRVSGFLLSFLCLGGFIPINKVISNRDNGMNPTDKLKETESGILSDTIYDIPLHSSTCWST